MAQAGELVGRVLQRVRDEHATGSSREFVRRILAACQRLVNAKFGLVLEGVEFTTIPYQQVYNITPAVPRALRLVGVWEGQRDLTEVKWAEFWYLHRDWLRDVGNSFQSFSLIGRDMLVLYPAQTQARVVTLRTAVLTSELASDDTVVELPDEYHPLLVDLACAMTLTKMRTFASMEKLADSIKSRLTP